MSFGSVVMRKKSYNIFLRSRLSCITSLLSTSFSIADSNDRDIASQISKDIHSQISKDIQTIVLKNLKILIKFSKVNPLTTKTDDGLCKFWDHREHK